MSLAATIKAKMADSSDKQLAEEVRVIYEEWRRSPAAALADRDIASPDLEWSALFPFQRAAMIAVAKAVLN